MTILLDASVLVALVVVDHVHHDAAETWFSLLDDDHATCPVTQGALIRLALRHGATPGQAVSALSGATEHRRHRFWADALSYEQVSLAGVVGQRQVTDAYLAGLARHNRGRLATFDGGLAALHPDVAVLVPRDDSGPDGH